MVIRFFASIRNITGVREIEWGEPAPMLGDLLRLLSDRYGPEFRRWVLEGEDLGGSVMVVVNGNDARHQAGLATHLAATDVVSILPIMAGGKETSRALSDQLSAFSKGTTTRVGSKRLTPAVIGRFCVALVG
jgi:MoaD family protein